MPEPRSSFGRDLHLNWAPETGRNGLTQAIRAAIRNGRLVEGARLPSTRSLATDLGLARGTVTKVYDQLASEGYLRTSQGAPTTVATRGAAPASAPRPRQHPPRPRWNLLPGHPDLSSFPRSLWLSATRRVLDQTPSEALGYAEQQGDSGLRAALSRYLGRTRGVLADPERIVICGGYSEAISLLASVLENEGASEFTFEDPSLPRFREIVTSAGPRVRAAPVDEHGIQVSRLDSPVVVATPAHQYPLGVTLAPHRRAELARLATRSDMVIVEDDYDGEFRFDRANVGALQALAPERVAYAGTVSKTLAPALRLGWLVLPRALVVPVNAAMAARGSRSSVLQQLVLAELLDSGGYDQHVRKRRSAYRARRNRLLAALPNHVTPRGIAAGLHMLLTLPEDGPTEADVLAAAANHSVAIQTLGDHWISGGRHPAGVIVGYTNPAAHAFAPALDAFLATLADVAQ